MPPVANLFAGLAPGATEEIFTELLKTPHLRLERIVSTGQASAPGEWYDQAWDEWVLLLSGRAALAFAGEPGVCELGPGDYLLIPAHCRHRVAWTDPTQPSVWLALHLAPITQPGIV